MPKKSKDLTCIHIYWQVINSDKVSKSLSKSFNLKKLVFFFKSGQILWNVFKIIIDFAIIFRMMVIFIFLDEKAGEPILWIEGVIKWLSNTRSLRKNIFQINSEYEEEKEAYYQPHKAKGNSIVVVSYIGIVKIQPGSSSFKSKHDWTC